MSQFILILPFFSPLSLILLFARGLEEAKNLAGQDALRLIQIRVAKAVVRKSRLLVKHNRHQHEPIRGRAQGQGGRASRENFDCAAVKPLTAC
jgi:hypothetical protein